MCTQFIWCEAPIHLVRGHQLIWCEATNSFGAWPPIHLVWGHQFIWCGTSIHLVWGTNSFGAATNSFGVRIPIHLVWGHQFIWCEDTYLFGVGHQFIWCGAPIHLVWGHQFIWCRYNNSFIIPHHKQIVVIPNSFGNASHLLPSTTNRLWLFPLHLGTQTIRYPLPQIDRDNSQFIWEHKPFATLYHK